MSLLAWMLGTKFQPLQEQQALLTSKLCLQTPDGVFFRPSIRKSGRISSRVGSTSEKNKNGLQHPFWVFVVFEILITLKVLVFLFHF